METAEHYWSAAENGKDALRKLVNDWHPGRRLKTDSNGPINAVRAELACRKIRGEIETWSPPGRQVLVEFDKALTEKDGITFSRIMSETWFGLPESLETRKLPGFHLLCDLCSESHLVLPGPIEG